MAALRWLPDAFADLKRLHAFIEPYSAQASNRAVTALIAASDSLADFLEKGKPGNMDMDCRELPVRFGLRGYVIRYRYYDDQVIIVRVYPRFSPLSKQFENMFYSCSH